MTVDALTLRLRFWLWLMSSCEHHHLTETELYHWLVRRAAGCNRWRKQ